MPDPQGQPQQQQSIQLATDPASASPTVGADPTLSQIAATVQEPIAQPSGNEPPQNTQQQVDEQAKHFQRLAEQRQVENYRLQQQLLEMQQRTIQPQQQSQNANPYDPNTQPTEWWRAENQRMINEAVEKVAQAQRQEFTNMIGTYSALQWQQQHQDVDINAIQAFQRVRGITNLDDAYKLWKLDNSVPFNNPNPGFIPAQPRTNIAPIRNVQGAGEPPTAGWSFDKLLQQEANNPGTVARLEQQYPGIQDSFRKELLFRRANQG